MGFSRQEYWNSSHILTIIFKCIYYVEIKSTNLFQSINKFRATLLLCYYALLDSESMLLLSRFSCVQLFESLPGSSVDGDSSGKNIGVGCHFLLQGILPTQRLMSPALAGHSKYNHYWKKEQTSHLKFGLDIGVDGSPSARELKRRYYYFWEELGGHEFVQGDLSRAEEVDLGLPEVTKGWDCGKFPSMGRLNFLLTPEEEVNSGSS